MSKYFGMTVLFVKNFDRCFDFYRNALGMAVIRSYNGVEHPEWALLQLGELRMALHAGYDNSPLKTNGPICMNFFTENMPATVEKIQKYGGSIINSPEEYDFRPTQPVKALFGRFADPDGNEHFFVKETERLE